VKAFVRDRNRDSWDPVRLGIFIGTMMFAAETLGEVAYLPVYAFLAFELAKRFRKR
jgi:hypothetical protein